MIAYGKEYVRKIGNWGGEMTEERRREFSMAVDGRFIENMTRWLEIIYTVPRVTKILIIDTRPVFSSTGKD